MLAMHLQINYSLLGPFPLSMSMHKKEPEYKATWSSNSGMAAIQGLEDTSVLSPTSHAPSAIMQPPPSHAPSAQSCTHTRGLQEYRVDICIVGGGVNHRVYSVV